MNLWSAFLAILVSFAAASTALATSYSVTVIGPAGSDAYGVNNLGNVVGSTPNGAVTDPFMWTPGGGLHDLGTLGGSSVARAINDNNWVVGQSNDSAFRWTASGGLVQLGNNLVITETSYGDARAINNANTIIGSGDPGNDAWTQIWSGGNIGALIPFVTRNSVGYAINDSGVYVGELIGYPYSNTGYIQAPGYSSGLGSLLPDAINDPGQIVGSDSGVAVILDPITRLETSFGTLNHTDTSSEAFAINNLGQAVGVSTGTGAFLWDSTHGIQNLSTMLASGSAGWTILSGNGINNSGQIVGQGQIAGQDYAVLLTPTPEPSSILLLGLGALGLLLARRRGC